MSARERRAILAVAFGATLLAIVSCGLANDLGLSWFQAKDIGVIVWVAYAPIVYRCFR